MSLSSAIDASVRLAEKRAGMRDDDPRARSLRERHALVDFDAFGRLKRAGVEEIMSLAKKPLAWGLGLGIPALGVGHALISDAHHQGKDLVRDARNQALLTAAGIGGMQSLGGLLQSAVSRGRGPSAPETPYDASQRIAADVRVDDLLETACHVGDRLVKHAALVSLIIHRTDAMRRVRALVR